MSRAAVAVDRRRRPVAGYPSQTAACVALQAEGCDPDEIGRRIGRDPYHVRATLRRIEHGEKPRVLALPNRVVPGLAGEAAARGGTPAELALQLLERVIEDDLFEPLLGEPSFDAAQCERCDG